MGRIVKRVIGLAAQSIFYTLASYSTNPSNSNDDNHHITISWALTFGKQCTRCFSILLLILQQRGK